MKHLCRVLPIALAALAASTLFAGCSLLSLIQPEPAPVITVEPTAGPATPSPEAIAITEAGERLAGLQAEIARTREETERARAAARADAGRTAPIVIACAGCTVNGSASFRLKEAGESVTVRAEIPNDLILDHWEINGERIDQSGSSFSFAPDASCFVEAFCCRRRILTSVHATFRLLDEKGRAGGRVFTDFDFQEDYFNPASETYHPGGTVSAVITASVPANHEIAYWLIDGVVYRFNRTVTSITVTDLDRAAVYEPVFKSTGAPDPEPSRPGPTPLPAPLGTY